MPPINPMRALAVGAAVTQEEVAFRLFSIIAATSDNGVESSDILPLFAKCMIAVEKPELFLAQLETYNIKPQQQSGDDEE
ncbi:hypothetical protein [uncultured Bartonella sp.]|uniref:hypothetical protein n=1 Tax=uncultured Bartonella sp. TaxID=104108 RepID=UPI0026245ABC|nr:hypothetical protein [uncultured Bartonella sp.]